MNLFMHQPFMHQPLITLKKIYVNLSYTFFNTSIKHLNILLIYLNAVGHF